MSIESAKVVSLIPDNSKINTQGAGQGATHVEQLEVAKVEGARNGSLNDVVIQIDGRQETAKVSFSCLVQPEINDSVLIARDAVGQFFVLSILEREGSQDLTMAFQGSAKLQSMQGSVDIFSAESISMTSSSIHTVSEESVYRSKKTYVDSDQLTANGKTAQVNYSNIRVLSDMINTIAKQAIQKFQGYIRHTDKADQVKAGQMTRDVEGLYSMDSNHTIMLSKKDTKIDAERIHMG